MSTKHLFPTADGLVVKSLQGLISSNPSLSIIPKDKVVFDTRHSRSRVSIISGGGAGHEPAWCGYVGQNMLAAAASGDIFASPSARQIESAIRSVPSDEGTILVITNYTGDCLHFGMACEKANSAGFQKGPVAVITCGDDVSIGKSKNSLVGRRGLPGQLLVLKVLGAASEKGYGFEKLIGLANELKDQLVTIATTLDHCHVPGRAEHAALNEDTIEIGTGPHNEPGYKKISPQPSPEDLIKQIIQYLTDESDAERGYVKFAEGDEVVVLMNNFGGMSVLEMYALTDEVLNQLPKHIRSVRVYTGVFETSLNAPAFSVTLCNLTAAAKKSGVHLEEILTLLDTKTDTVWEGVAGNQAKRLLRNEQVVESPRVEEITLPEIASLTVDPKILEESIRKACNAVIASEPNLTKWDTIMGDGDCGETFTSGAQELLKALNSGLASKGSILSVSSAVAHITETKMGGTLGAILSIFFSALTSELIATSSIYNAPSRACSKLEQYTAARVGHRTIMDVLIPFTRALEETESFAKARDAAVKGAERTRGLGAKLGRATYVGGMQEDSSIPPDPGAWGAMEAVKGIAEGLGL